MKEQQIKQKNEQLKDIEDQYDKQLNELEHQYQAEQAKKMELEQKLLDVKGELE